MVAQPLLECHYSLHGAFLAEPLLEVRPCQLLKLPPTNSNRVRIVEMMYITIMFHVGGPFSAAEVRGCSELKRNDL